MKLNITVNNAAYTAEQGETILQVLNRNGFEVPTLCNMKGFIPSGTCRICVVENESTGKLLPACSYPVEDGMRILTHSAKVIEARKTIVELLLSNHPDDCLYCVRNNQCTLQSLARELRITERRMTGKKNSFKLDHSGSSIVRDPEKCILCGRCIRVCEEVMGVSAIDFINRGSKTCVGTTFNKGLNTSSCVNCGQCIIVCPTGALTEKSHLSRIQEVLTRKDKTLVVQYAPAISVSFAEAFGLEAGKDVNGLLNAALRRIGFNYVFDTTFSADLTIMEEGSELISRIMNNGKLPMFTSCCPAWIKYVEEFAPEFIENLSTCKSPQQMLGAVIKSYFAEKNNLKAESIFSVSIMPCTAKKFESERDTMGRNGYRDVDAVLTTRELVDLIKMYGIDLKKLKPENTDTPFGIRSSAGKLFAASGGVMEAAIRSAFHLLTGKEMIKYQIESIRGLQGRKEMKLNIEGKELGIAVVSGLSNAKALLDEIRNGRTDLHFIEVMTCPGGCIAGGGQLFGCEEAVNARMQTLYEIDETESLKVSHKNPEIIQIYKDYFGKPLEHKSHELLHTHYHKRDVLL